MSERRETSAEEERGKDPKDPTTEKPSTSRGLYEEGDRVLVPEGDLFYEGKVLASEKENGRWTYFVHYQGWNKKWDEWLPASKLIQDTPESRFQEHSKIQSAADSSKRYSKHSVAGNKSKKRKVEDKETDEKKERKKEEKKREDEEEDEMAEEAVLRINLPVSLKKRLAQDAELVSKQEKTLSLPRSPTVKKLLKDFLEASTKHQRRDLLLEVVSGIQVYFDRALPTMLLYKTEREQCTRVLKSHRMPSDIYGIEHLLRLLIKLPELLPYENLEEPAVRALETKIAVLVGYIKRNEHALFSREEHPGKEAESGKQD